jgi:hypothetical protein
MQIVNGYICMNCCDVDKARKGQDPHQSTNQLQKQIERHIDKLSSGNFDPAVSFGGSLQDMTAAPGANGNVANGSNADESGGNGENATSYAPEPGQNGSGSPPSLNVIA